MAGQLTQQESAAQGVVGAVAAPLFQVYLIPFEITSILLLVGHHRRGRARQAEGLMLLGPALGLSAMLFSLGVAGVLLRRNAIVLFMCIELMLNAVNLSFVALAQLHGASGYVMVFFVMTVAAAEAAVGLAIIIGIFRHKQSVDLGNINLLRG